MILAYDFGTGGIKAALFDERGVCCRDAFAGYATEHPADGWHEQRPDDWWRAVVASTRALGDLAGVTAIGLSGHSLGVVPVDAAGNLLCASVPIWCDARAGAEAAEFFATGLAEEAWYLKTGCGFPPALYACFKMMWLKRHAPEAFGRATHILGTKDWVNFRLTGVRATDSSYASGSGVYDLRTRRYDEDLVARTGLPRALFTEIVPSTQVLGTVLPEVAAALGLPPGVRVVAGGVDNSCMALGAGAYREGRAYASLGSSAWIAVSGAQPVLDARTRPYVFDHVVPGQYASALAIFSAGTSHTWLRDVLGLDYAALDALAVEAGVGAHGLFFNPSLAGGSSLDPTSALRGGFANLSLGHTRADLVRAVMEGIAFGLLEAFEGLRAAVPVAEPLRLTGGGAKAPLWRRLYADVFGVEVAASAIGQQCAALGAAALAAVGTGVWDSFAPLDARAAASAETVKPDPEAARQYAALRARHRALTRHLAAWALDDASRLSRFFDK